MISRRNFTLLAACAPFLASTAAAAAQDRATIRIGTHIAISVHLFMQLKPELMRNMGKTYDVDWVNFSGAGDAAPALVAGQLDGCLATPFPVANALFQSHVPVTIVHQLLSFGFDGYYSDATVVRADSGISKFADLKGKVVGVNAIGSTQEQGVRIMARKSGLDPDRDLTIVEVRPPFAAQMVRDGKVQAVTLLEPFYEQAMKKGGLKVLFTTDDIYGGPTDYVFMIFTNAFLKAHPQAVRDYVADYLRAVNWALDHRSEAVKLYAEHWKLPEAIIDSYLLTKKDYLVRRNGRVAAKNIQPIVDALAENHFIARSFDISKYIDVSYLPKQ